MAHLKVEDADTIHRHMGIAYVLAAPLHTEKQTEQGNIYKLAYPQNLDPKLGGGAKTFYMDSYPTDVGTYPAQALLTGYC